MLTPTAERPGRPYRKPTRRAIASGGRRTAHGLDAGPRRHRPTAARASPRRRPSHARSHRLWPSRLVRLRGMRPGDDQASAGWPVQPQERRPDIRAAKERWRAPRRNSRAQPWHPHRCAACPAGSASSRSVASSACRVPVASPRGSSRPAATRSAPAAMTPRGPPPTAARSGTSPTPRGCGPVAATAMSTTSRGGRCSGRRRASGRTTSSPTGRVRSPPGKRTTLAGSSSLGGSGIAAGPRTRASA